MRTALQMVAPAPLPIQAPPPVLSPCPNNCEGGRVWVETRPVWGGDLRDECVQCPVCQGAGMVAS